MNMSTISQKLFQNALQAVHFGEDKTKSILFSKTRCSKEINISFAGHSIEQQETVEYLSCQLDSKLSGEAMASKVLKKINAKLKFLYRQSRYLTPVYRRLLCNALIQPHFNYGCFSWFPLLKKNLKTRNSKSSTKVFVFAKTYLRGLISIHCTLEKQTGFQLVTEQITVLRIPFLSTGMELYQDMFMKCLNFHSADVV